jgi:hypothetical protein
MRPIPGWQFKYLSIVLVSVIAAPAIAQQIKEYIRLGGRVIAIESSGTAFSPTAGAISPAGGPLFFDLTVSPSTLINAVNSNVSWVRLALGVSTSCPSLSGSYAAGPLNVTGSARICLWVDSNPGASRNATVGTAAVTYSLTQDALGASFTLTPQSATVSPLAGRGEFAVDDSSNTANWTVIAAVPNFAQVNVISTAGNCASVTQFFDTANGTGDQKVCFSYSANSGFSNRTQSFIVSGANIPAKTFPLIQNGSASCSLSLNKNAIVAPPNPASSTPVWSEQILVTVVGQASVVTATPSASWITSTAPQNLTFTISAAPNTASTPRTGTVTFSAPGCSTILNVDQQGSNSLTIPTKITVRPGNTESVPALWNQQLATGVTVMWHINQTGNYVTFGQIGDPILADTTGASVDVRALPSAPQGATFELTATANGNTQKSQGEIVPNAYFRILDVSLLDGSNQPVTVGSSGTLQARYEMPRDRNWPTSNYYDPFYLRTSRLYITPGDWASVEGSGPTCVIDHLFTPFATTQMTVATGGTSALKHSEIGTPANATPVVNRPGPTSTTILNSTTCRADGYLGDVSRTIGTNDSPAAWTQRYGGFALNLDPVTMPPGTKKLWIFADTVPLVSSATTPIAVSTFTAPVPQNSSPVVNSLSVVPPVVTYNGISTLTAVFSDADGLSTASYLEFAATDAAESRAGACIVQYLPVTNQFRLLADDPFSGSPTGNAAAATWAPSALSSPFPQNSKCIVKAAQYLVGNGSLSAQIEFKAAFSGAHLLTARAKDRWDAIGTSVSNIIVNSNPTTSSPATVSPSSGQATTVTIRYDDPEGYNDLRELYVRLKPVSGGAMPQCLIRYDRTNSSVSVRDAADQSWLTSPANVPGICNVTSTTLTPVAGSSTGLNFAVGIGFDWAFFAGNKTIEAWATDSIGQNIPVTVGSFNVVAQDSNYQSLPIYGTGVSASGTGLAIDGGSESRYILKLNPSGAGTFPTYVTILDTALRQAWVAGGASSKWISPTSNAYSSAEGNYRYDYTFSLAGYDPATVRIFGRVTADNSVRVLLNNVEKLPYAAGQTDFQQWQTFSLSSGFVDGNNTLSFEVKNQHPCCPGASPSGLQVAIDSAFGRAAVTSYSLQASAISATQVAQGGIVQYSVALSGLGVGTVPLVVIGSLPTGVTVAFGTNPVAFGQASVVTITTSASTPNGSYSISVGGDSSHSVPLPFAVAPPVTTGSFTLTALRRFDSTQVTSGSGVFPIRVQSVSGFAGQVVFSAPVVSPSGVTCSVPSATVTANGSTDVNMTCPATAMAGGEYYTGTHWLYPAYTINVTGTSGSLSQTINGLTFVVKPWTLPDFPTLTPVAITTPLSMQAGTVQTFTVESPWVVVNNSPQTGILDVRFIETGLSPETVTNSCTFALYNSSALRLRNDSGDLGGNQWFGEPWVGSSSNSRCSVNGVTGTFTVNQAAQTIRWTLPITFLSPMNNKAIRVYVRTVNDNYRNSGWREYGLIHVGTP